MRNRSIVSARTSGSRPFSGSSSTSSSGSCAIACARRTRCRMPFEYAATLRFAASVSPRRSSAFHAFSSAADRPYPKSSSPVVMNVNPVAQRGAVSYCVAYPVIRISASGSRGEMPRMRMRPWSG